MECKGVDLCQCSRDKFLIMYRPRFRWVFCQLETLRRSVQRNLRGILERLPKTLDETYERILKDINEDNREYARRLLHCLAVSIRPLRVEELAEILAFDFDDAHEGIPKFHAGWRWKDKEDAVLSTCSSLIAVVDSRDFIGRMSRVVQYSHFSVKEFLISDRLASSTPDVSRYHIIPGPAHTILAQVCLGFLLHFDHRIYRECVGGFPFAGYAAEHWVAHARFDDVASRVKNGMRSLFDPNKPHLLAWLRIYNIDSELDVHEWDTPNPLYYASLCGFHDLVEHLVPNHPQLVNAIHGLFESPLLAALSRNHIRVAEFLLRHGGNVNVWGPKKQTPVHCAILCYHWPHDDMTMRVVPFLLNHGADVNARDDDLCTPLHLAAKDQLLDVSQRLLEHGADVNSRNDKGEAPLHMTYYNERFNPDHLPRLLLEHGANANAQDNDRVTPLQIAVSRCDVDNARILLEHGADPNVTDMYGQTALHFALKPVVDEDDLDILTASAVWLLLEHDADVNAQNKYHTTPLVLAIQHCMYDIARVLLARGAEPDVEGDNGNTPLHYLLEAKYSDDVDALDFARLLLDRGVDVNALDKNHNTPLLLAAKRCEDDIMRILLERGADPNVKNDKCKTALHLLLERKFDDHDNIDGALVVERLLLENGADVYAQDDNNSTPVHLASNHPRRDVAQIILDHANSEKDWHLTQSQIASEGEYNS